MSANRKLAVSALMVALTLSASTLTACGDEQASPRGNMQVDPEGVHSCRASVEPGDYEYLLEGSSLTLSSDLEPADLKLTREGSRDDLFDTWLAFEESSGESHLRIFVELKPNRFIVRSACDFADGVSLVAEVTSRAIYSGSTIEVLDGAEDIVEK